MIHLLADAGADLNARSESGYTPLHLAALSGGVKTTAALLTRGVFPSTLNPQPSTLNPEPRALVGQRVILHVRRDSD